MLNAFVLCILLTGADDPAASSQLAQAKPALNQTAAPIHGNEKRAGAELVLALNNPEPAAFNVNEKVHADNAGKQNHAKDHSHGPNPVKLVESGTLWWLLVLIPGLPFISAFLLGLFGKTIFRGSSHVICIAAIFGSFLCAIALFMIGDTGHQPIVVKPYTWMSVGQVSIDVLLRADALTTMMLCMVTFVATLVAIYASGYMHGDGGYPRFFAAVSLFVFSMCMLVLSSNLVLLYVFWEAVGLCSYLLIGFWFQKPSAAAASMKAFLVNRIGDFGFALGIFLVWVMVGQVTNWQAPAGQQLLDYDVVLSKANEIATKYPGMLTVACLLLFMGAMGKSAQFPLHVWLPDAMEGPTPVSALIHAATMVTAGIYMVARLTPLFVLAPFAQMMVAVIGGISALLAALIALTQYDLKRVMAYSTVSQLGFMFMSLGAACAGPEHAGFAVMSAMFHLFTHAFFKALLFLGSGSVMHSMGDVIDMRRFSGLRRVMPITHWTFLAGALALAGFPLLTGFWSKDEILLSLDVARQHSPYPVVFGVLQGVAMLTSLMTAFYTFRAYFMTFWGPEKFPEEAHHPHESPISMTLPLMILSVFAIGVGMLLGPTHLFAHHIYQTPGIPESHASHNGLWIMITSGVLAVVGIAVAYLMYAGDQKLAAGLKKGLAPLHALSFNKFYFDELFYSIIVYPVKLLAVFSATILDKTLVDNLVNLIGTIPRRIGEVLRPWQNGLVQTYAAISLLALAVFVLSLLNGLAG